MSLARMNNYGATRNYYKEADAEICRIANRDGGRVRKY